MTTHSPSIGEQVQTYMTGPAAALPPEVMGAFAAEQVDLDAAGVPAAVSAPGAVMPDGELLDVHGATTSLALVRGGRPAVVVFYRGAWCPFCNIALRTYQAELAPALADRGVAMIAVSPQKPDGSLTVAETNELSYAVVSDPGNQIASALGILTEPSANALAAQEKVGLDLAEQNADGGRTLPMPTTVVVDHTGVIRWIDVHPNYTTRSEVPDILAAVDALS
ncbi:peroxiredoxin-like family protein [Mycobacterium sp.]|jgi:peroxiredoxin|uniref:peroxiredoxin-like family protein n=1 Tax=Mycobacterium sp. TaxID=1785 RepID=UPI002C27C973|nr:peroxiredoxin-like family protein [Mycobacterium sp.]HXB87392.1 peroxiredoxin-like family protein [Mycobacterium sp.]